MLGDFGCPPQSSELDVLRKEKLCPLVPSTQFTNISTRSPQGNRCLDNIWLSRSLKKIYSGKNSLLTFHFLKQSHGPGCVKVLDYPGPGVL